MFKIYNARLNAKSLTSLAWGDVQISNMVNDTLGNIVRRNKKRLTHFYNYLSLLIKQLQVFENCYNDYCSYIVYIV